MAYPDGKSLAEVRFSLCGRARCPSRSRAPEGKSAKGAVSGTAKPQSDNSAGEGGSGSGSTQSTQVEITLDGGFAPTSAEFTGTSSVKFIAKSRKGVLTVPVEAIVALREGGYGLQIVKGTTTKSSIATMVRVEIGMTADGRIEVTGSGLSEGMKVGVAKQ